MPQFTSDRARRNLNAVNAVEPMLVLLEITHPDLEIPIRVVNNTENIISNGNTFQYFPFNIELPDDLEGQAPNATLTIDNVGREISTFLENTRGGLGSKCRVMQALASTLDDIEFDMTFDMSNMSVTMSNVTATLEFANTLYQPSVTVQYRPETTPDVF